METLLSLLQSICPDIDFQSETSLVDDGLIDSVQIVTIIEAIEEAFDISVTMEYIQPAYFQSAAAMMEMIEELQ